MKGRGATYVASVIVCCGCGCDPADVGCWRCGAAGRAAEENEYVLLIDDFEDEETIAHYSSYAAQPGSLYQSKTHAHSGENSAMFVSQGAYGCVVNQPDFNNQIRLTADGEVLEAGSQQCL